MGTATMLGAATLVATALASAPSGLATAEPTPVTADITVTMDFYPNIGNAGPKVLSISGVTVGSGVELDPTSPGVTIDNPSLLCGAVYVDVSLDPSTVTVHGTPDECQFTDVVVEVTFHGALPGSPTVISDSLFGAPVGPGPHDVPVLTRVTTAGPTFSAEWSGGESNHVSTSPAAFGLSLLTAAPPARSAEGSPNFTG